MRVTSSQAAKLLRQLNDELRALQLKEANSCSFVAAIQEDVESVRPAYNFKEMRDAQAEVECKIRKVKHAINVFNTTTIIPDFNITIDEMLVYLPQLNRQCEVLSKMRDAMPKVRVSSGYSSGNIIDYKYANYDIEEVGRYYAELSDTLAKAQTVLDLVNSTVEFEIDI
nr:MAG TPA: septicolysin [Caudoviricetes sp.]